MNDDAFTKALGTVIRDAADAARIGPTDLAERAGLSRASLYRYLAGEREITVSSLLALADAIGVPAADLLGAAQERIGADSEG